MELEVLLVYVGTVNAFRQGRFLYRFCNRISTLENWNSSKFNLWFTLEDSLRDRIRQDIRRNSKLTDIVWRMAEGQGSMIAERMTIGAESLLEGYEKSSDSGKHRISRCAWGLRRWTTLGSNKAKALSSFPKHIKPTAKEGLRFYAKLKFLIQVMSVLLVTWNISNYLMI